MIDRPARKKSAQDLISSLDEGRDALLTRYDAAQDNDANHKVMTHIIGIERWGQTRLRQALGEPPGEVEYDTYRPPQDTPWGDLRPLFEETRAETIRLAGDLDTAGKLDAVVPHNTFGDFSIRGWLSYLASHSNLESKRLK
jgi:hypothetical protein